MEEKKWKKKNVLQFFYRSEIPHPLLSNMTSYIFSLYFSIYELQVGL